MKPDSHARLFLRWLAMLAGLLASAQALSVTLSDNPLFIPTPLAPNIILTLDDSGSMRWGYAPDSIGDTAAERDTRRFKSATFNPMYYNPQVSYDPGVNADGTTRSTSFTAAKRNGFYDYATNNTVNLSTSYRPVYDYDPSTNDNDYAENPSADFPGQENSGVAAYYYRFKTTCNSQSSTDLNDENCYEKVTVSATSGPGGTDERQNFANWYSFYRTRSLMTVTAASRAFASVSAESRVAWQALNSCSSFGTSCSGWGGTAVTNKIRKFTGAHRTDFYYWLFRLPASGGTPLLEAMERAGEYYRTTGLDSPYAYDPGTTDAPEYSCRPNFHVMMTDGIWNNNTLSGSYGNYDSTNRALPDGKTYTARYPYQDGNSASLADIAFYYWANDLTALNNNQLPHYTDRTGTADEQYWNAKNDPATWQHMVNFTVGLGLNTLLTNPDWGGDTYAGDYPALVAGSKTWPATGDNVSPGNVADLWHAAINSRGKFFGADDPDALNIAFQGAISSIQSRESSAAALATNSTRLGTDTVIYQAKFNSGDWTGQLIAYAINSDGSLGNKVWDVTDPGKIPLAASRNIKTWSGTAGIDFLWASLTSTQKNAIDSANVANTSSPVLDYLRGDQSNELQNGGSYRNRSRRLGDIINSDPIFVHAPNFGYSVLTEGLASGATPYATFISGNQSRTKMIYVGANDGMLHAFDATTGEEKFAYVPNEVMTNLASLKSTTYAHKYFVDGSPFVGDAFVSSAWKTVLLGTTGAGGKAVFALDVTDPTAFTTSKVLWEFTHAELGNTIGQPVIARVAYNNRWAAIFGNGYNSTAGTAKLFMVFLDANPADGWQVGKDADYMVFDTDSTTNNGLASPTLYDSDGDKVVDTVYAGDMQGNVWKFDISGTNTNAWGVAYKSGSTPKPLFTARNASNQVQPITAPVEIGAPPPGKTGVMIYFGTGRFFATGDNTNLEVQSLYGVLDAGSRITTTDRSELQQQTILYEGTDTGTTGRTATTTQIRVLSNTAVNWTTKKGWYLDLVQPPSSTAQGERVISIPLLRHGRVIFTTLVPSTDPCQFGGTSWIMEMDALTGGRLSESVFDLNNDSNFNATDYVTVTVGGVEITVPVSAVKSTVGIIKTPTVVTAGTVEYKLASGTTGEISSTKEKSSAQGTGRVSWRELVD
ncbi:type IV pilus assembly protein PilY1 [Sulfuritortus calidifontis]|uniref:Type IV pilus assembly protein PilY1 n=1 Tax=Sulfuritortus calidifontis TaxID=1914471 RepID=A0A4R3JZ08_9PROT|nr:PilC/PilY family type IV pilus protein [Sulfuritortus calidifontis]TCS72714.1 type IV pilus assembly protein PilY1 [Sulfuritortus calidifontis]